MLRPHRLEQSSFVRTADISLVLGLSSRLTYSQDINFCSATSPIAGLLSAPLIPLYRFFARYKFVTYLLTY